MTFVRIREWSKYQHYKHRNPPWIKLHRELLTSSSWACADDASRVLAIACMLLAAATGNKIPLEGGYIKRVAYLNSEPDFSFLLSMQFVEFIDENGLMLATASKLLTNADSETETETEQSKRHKNHSSRCASTDSIFEKAYSQYPRHVGKRAAKTAWTNAVNRVWGLEENAERAQSEEMIYQRVMTYAAVCEKARKEKQFIPHMATWLNQDRFMDDPSEWAVTEKTNGNGTSKDAERNARNRAAILKGSGLDGFLDGPNVPAGRDDGTDSLLAGCIGGHEAGKNITVFGGLLKK